MEVEINRIKANLDGCTAELKGTIDKMNNDKQNFNTSESETPNKEIQELKSKIKGLEEQLSGEKHHAEWQNCNNCNKELKQRIRNWSKRIRM